MGFSLKFFSEEKMCELGIQSTVYNNRVSICPGLHNDKMHASFEKHQKVSSFINDQQNKYNSVKYEVI